MDRVMQEFLDAAERRRIMTTESELYAEAQELDYRMESVEQEIAQIKEMLFTQAKTLEGIQQLFIRAGEYQGKPRGRLPG